MGHNTSETASKILNLKDQWDSQIPQFRQKVNKLYGNESENTYNPFLDKNGNLFNPYINYQAALDNPNVTQKAKEFITQATGLTPTQAIPATRSGGAVSDTNIVSGAANNSDKTQSADIAEASGTASGAEAASSLSGNKFVDTAKKYLGTKYVWGGSSPSGFDCSGLMQYTFAQNGVTIPRTAREQYKGGAAVSQNNLQAGDLVFFKGSTGSSTSPGHVGMYIGNGQYIQAPKTGDVVKISNLADRKDYVGARRYY